MHYRNVYLIWFDSELICCVNMVNYNNTVSDGNSIATK